MLPHKKLANYYKKVTWLYVCRTFKKGSAKDAEALRTHDRFGISSWPQMFLFDPADDRVLQEAPRNLDAFIATFDRVLGAFPKKERASAKVIEQRDSHQRGGQERSIEERLSDQDPRVRSIALEDLLQPSKAGSIFPKVQSTIENMFLNAKEDIVVRIRALRLLRKKAALVVSKNANKLLTIANDPWRYELLAHIKEHPDRKLSPILVRILQAAGKEIASRNPNVLRIRASECLRKSGDIAAIQTLSDLARTGNPLNVLTRYSIKAMGEIGRRATGKDRILIIAELIAAMPPAALQQSATAKRHPRLGRIIHALVRENLAAIGLLIGTDKLPDLPATWDAASRETVLTSLKATLSALARQP